MEVLSPQLKVFILVGIPGSGKSTAAQQIIKNYSNEKFKIVNQDKLGNREKCIDFMHAALEANYNVIVDRTNVSVSQRKHWINVANYYAVERIYCVVLDLDPEEALARVSLRKDHPTITESLTLDEKRDIVYKFFNSYEQPTIDEGFSSILITKG